MLLSSHKNRFQQIPLYCLSSELKRLYATAKIEKNRQMIAGLERKMLKRVQNYHKSMVFAPEMKKIQDCLFSFHIFNAVVSFFQRRPAFIRGPPLGCTSSVVEHSGGTAHPRVLREV